MDMMIANLHQQQQTNEQLRREVAVRRIMVSQAVQDILKYIQEHEPDDCLVKGFTSAKSNPFREKGGCCIL